MDIEKIWNESEWPTEARQIINGLTQFQKDSKIILILRHSQRDEPENLEEMHKLRLTPEGHTIAKKFGEELPSDRPIRLFHSVIWRCQETAEDILSGFETIGGKGKMKGVFAPLYDLQTAPKFFSNVFNNYTGDQFIYRWVAGLYPQDQITSLQQYCQKAAKLIWKEYKKAPDKNIDIHITHDLFIIALKLGWFGIPPRNNWVSFLGGFALVFEKNSMLLLDSDGIVTTEIPYWWEIS